MPPRLTQISSLVSRLGSSPTFVTLPTGATEGQSSMDVSDSDGPTSFPSDSSQSQLPSGAAPRGSGGSEGQNHSLLCSFIHARDSTGDGSLVSSQALGICSGPRRTRSFLPATLDQRAFSDPDVKGQPPRRGGEQGKESLMQCVKVNSTFKSLRVDMSHFFFRLVTVNTFYVPGTTLYLFPI